MTNKRFTPPTGQDRQLRGATVLPASFNEADNSFEVCWTTGAAVKRFDWIDGEFYDETLSVKPGAVRLERLDDRGPFLNSHQQDDVNALLGSVVPGSIRLQGGNGYARVQMATSADVKNVTDKIKGGHLRKVSVGYMVHVYERIERKGQFAELRAVDWEPVEISLVTVPADPGAQIRSEGQMPKNSLQQPLDDDAGADDVVTAKFVRDKCRSLGFADEETLDLVEEYTERRTSRADFLDVMIDLVARKRDGRPVSRAGRLEEYVEQHRIGRIDNTDSSSYRTPFHANHASGQNPLAARMQGAIYARMANKPPAPESAEFMGASMVEMARGLLEVQGVRGTRWMPASQVWQLTKRGGAMTTSDFPTVLAGALNMFLTEQYASSPSALVAIASPREVNDFREIKNLWVDGDVTLNLVEENGEYTYGSVIEGLESYKIATFGKILSLTRQLIINDNLGAFAAMASWYAREGARKRAEILAAVINTNPAMADGAALFHANHGNLAGTGGAIAIDTLSAARKAMREQKDRDGISTMDIAPKFLVVGSAKETEAEQVLTQLAAAKTADVNPFPGKLELVVEPRIPGNAWYLFADPAQAPVLEYATLRGQGDDVFVDTRIGFERDAIETKARIDFGAGVVDYRGAYKNPGN